VEKRKLSSILDITPGAYACLAMVLMLVPLRWVLSLLIAAAVHESFHIGMIHLMGGQITSIRIGAAGAQIQVYPLPVWREILCAAAGPLGSGLLILSVKWLPEIALCGFIQALWNLIPLYPLDGGRIISGIIWIMSPNCAEKITKWIRLTVIGLTIVACVCAVTWLRIVFWPVAILVGLSVKTGVVKFPCKQPRLAVQ